MHVAVSSSKSYDVFGCSDCNESLAVATTTHTGGWETANRVIHLFNAPLQTGPSSIYSAKSSLCTYTLHIHSAHTIPSQPLPHLYIPAHTSSLVFAETCLQTSDRACRAAGTFELELCAYNHFRNILHSWHISKEATRIRHFRELNSSPRRQGEEGEGA